MSFIEWTGLGLLLVLLELFVPGIYLVFFGFAALTVAGGIYFLAVPVDPIYQILEFAIFSVIYASIGFVIYNRTKALLNDKKHENLNDLASQYIGQNVTVAQDVVAGKTKVAIGDGFWLAQTDADLKKGDKALIVGVRNGLIFLIEPVKE